MRKSWLIISISVAILSASDAGLNFPSGAVGSRIGLPSIARSGHSGSVTYNPANAINKDVDLNFSAERLSRLSLFTDNSKQIFGTINANIPVGLSDWNFGISIGNIYFNREIHFSNDVIESNYSNSVFATVATEFRDQVSIGFSYKHFQENSNIANESGGLFDLGINYHPLLRARQDHSIKPQLGFAITNLGKSDYSSIEVARNLRFGLSLEYANWLMAVSLGYDHSHLIFQNNAGPNYGFSNWGYSLQVSPFVELFQGIYSNDNDVLLDRTDLYWGIGLNYNRQEIYQFQNRNNNSEFTGRQIVINYRYTKNHALNEWDYADGEFSHLLSFGFSFGGQE